VITLETNLNNKQLWRIRWIINRSTDRKKQPCFVDVSAWEYIRLRRYRYKNTFSIEFRGERKDNNNSTNDHKIFFSRFYTRKSSKGTTARVVSYWNTSTEMFYSRGYLTLERKVYVFFQAVLINNRQITCALWSIDRRFFLSEMNCNFDKFVVYQLPCSISIVIFVALCFFF